MFRLLSSTALALVLAGGTAIAQNETPAPAMNEPAAPVADGAAESSQIIWEKTDSKWLTDDLIGTEVVNTNDESLGEIEQLLVAVKSEDDPQALKNDAPEYAEEPLTEGTPDTASGEAADDVASDESVNAPAQDLAFDDAASSDALPQDDTAASEPLPADENVAADDGGFADAMPEEDTAMTEPEATEENYASDETGSSDESIAPEQETVMTEPLPSEGETVMAPSEPETAELGVTHIVLGVGGFLGIGEKLVSIEADRFEFYKGDSGEQKIVLNATAEELESLPDFVERDDGMMGVSSDAPAEQY